MSPQILWRVVALYCGVPLQFGAMLCTTDKIITP